MSRYCWRLHPSSASRWPCSTPEQSVVSNRSRAVLSTKFCFNLNDDVYIRPKSAKELGISGRIEDISFNSTTKSSTTSDISPDSPSQLRKKRRLVEDVRVSIQQHSFDDTGRIMSCGATKVGIRPSRLFPVYDICKNENSITQQTLIVITPDTTNYRMLATSHLRSSDKVLEIGCSTGECTALMMRRLTLLHMHQQRQKKQIEDGENDNDASNTTFDGKIVAFDVGSDVLEQAQSRLLSEIKSLIPNDAEDMNIGNTMYTQLVTLQKVDAIADPKGAYAIAMTDRKPDIILIDIGGNRELKGVVRMIHWVQTAFENDPPRLVIVKSESLVEECSRIHNEQVEGKSSPLENESILSTETVRPNAMENGVLEYAQQWFSSLVSSFAESSDDGKCSSSEEQSAIPIQTVPKYSHPIQAPLALSPKDNVTPICRFHNYHPDGCKRRNGSNECPFDHDHCHWCKEIGHVALNCKR